MTEVIRAAAELRDVCDTHRWRYCFIGGLAVMRWGEPREAVDVDITLLTGFVDEAYIAALLARFDRPKDWVDVDGIIIRQSGRLDWPYVRAQLEPLAELKEAPEILDRLEKRRRELD